METLKFNFDINDSYVFSYSLYDGEVFIHCYVNDWSPSVLKMMYRTFSKFTSFLQGQGVTRFYSVTPNSKFTLLFNGKIEGVVYENGKKYEVVKWELN